MDATALDGWKDEGVTSELASVTYSKVGEGKTNIIGTGFGITRTYKLPPIYT